MSSPTFTYQTIIKETYLDFYGHVNNAMYLTLFEEARWELMIENGYGVDKISETGLGPVILSIKIDFLKELKARDEIVIETRLESYVRKIGKLTQQMIRNGEVCSTAEVVVGLFSLKERKLVPPTPEWLHAIGMG